jgi:hypothetical protein
MHIGITAKKIIQILNDKLALGPLGTIIGDLKCVKISDCGVYAYIGGVDGVVKLWELRGGRLELTGSLGNVVGEEGNLRDSMDFVL